MKWNIFFYYFLNISSSCLRCVIKEDSRLSVSINYSKLAKRVQVRTLMTTGNLPTYQQYT